MSDLQRTFAKAHLAKLPPTIPMYDEADRAEEEDEVSNLPLASPTDSSSSASSTGTVVPSPSKHLFQRPRTKKTTTLDPLPWNDFFTQELFFDRTTDDLHIRHHAYLIPPTSNGPLVVTHHGAGSSGLSFAVFARELTPLLPTAGILSLDARAHGLTTATSPGGDDAASLDLTLPTLAADLIYTVTSTLSTLPTPPNPHPIVLIGHSLGGAVITHIASSRLLPHIHSHIVLDVVEGSALDALTSMDTYLLTRPLSFPTLRDAISWHVSSHTIRNAESARVSVPPLLTQSKSSLEEISYTWTTPLPATKPFWPAWFTGLSSKFLAAPSNKLLILAGTDRLDRELIIGQMQGKYQLAIFPEAGHFVQEDQPRRTAEVVAEFYRRNEWGSLVLPPKVGMVKP